MVSRRENSNKNRVIRRSGHFVKLMLSDEMNTSGNNTILTETRFNFNTFHATILLNARDMSNSGSKYGCDLNRHSTSQLGEQHFW